MGTLQSLREPDEMLEKMVKKNMLHAAYPSLTSGGKVGLLPGLGWIVVGMVILLLTTMWPVFYLWGVPIPKTFAARFGGIGGTLTIYLGIIIFVRAVHPQKLLTPFSNLTIISWKAFLVLLLSVGIIMGNSIVAAAREFLFLWMLAEIMVAGVDDRFWYAVEKPLTVVFYITVPFMFVYYETPKLLVDSLSVSSANAAEVGGRYTWSLIYDLRPMIACGIFLGIWGFVRQTGGGWRMFQMFAPVPYFIIEVGLFQFRSVAFFLAIMVVSLLILRPLLESRSRPTATAMLLAVCIASLLIFVDSEQYDVFKGRSFESTNQESIFQSRLDELSAYRADMGWEIAIGRGLGGSFDASNVFPRHDGSGEWKTLHFGILVLTLKGGFLLLTIFIMFIGKGFRLRPKSWYLNQCNLTAAIFFPIIVLQLLLNPISLTPVGLFKFLPVMMVLSRFACAYKSDLSGNSHLHPYA